MKSIGRISVIVLIILAVICMTRSNEVKASSVEELKSLWYETHNYPMNPDSDEWKKYGLEEAFDILNPPEDLLHSFSTEKLAELMMDNPYLWVLTSYEYENVDYFFSYIQNSDIYNELMSRDDGILCLLKEYRNSNFDVKLCNENPGMLWGYNPMGNAEAFGCQFIIYHINNFNEEEYELCLQVMREKTSLYSELKDKTVKMYLSFVREQESAQELKKRWYYLRDYPLHWRIEGWHRYDMTDIIDILNPPTDLLLSMSTEELAKLVQEYPFMVQIADYLNTDVTQTYDSYFGFMEMFCDIFYELLRREDGVNCILKEYRIHQLNTQRLDGWDPVEAEWSPLEVELMWYAELFGRLFIQCYAQHFTEDEYMLACQIIEEKKELYSQLSDNLFPYFDLAEPKAPSGDKVSMIRTNYLKQADIIAKENKLAAARLQLMLKEIGAEDNSLPVVIPGTEDSNTVKQENSNDTEAESEDKATTGGQKSAVGENNATAEADKASDKDHKATTEAGETAGDSRAAGNDAVVTTATAKNSYCLIMIISMVVIIAVAVGVSGFVLLRRRRKNENYLRK